MGINFITQYSSAVYMGLYSLNVSTVSIGVAMQTLVAMYLIITHDN